MSNQTQTKDPITCHVLDTTTGRPAPGIITTLTCVSAAAATTTTGSRSRDGNPASIAHVATTNADGRILLWEAETEGQPSIAHIITAQGGAGSAGAGGAVHGVGEGQSLWKLQFNTGAYYSRRGIQSFFPVVELVFLVREGERFHVPLLLGPFSYTTYRGS